MCEQDKLPSKMLSTVLELGLQSVFPDVYVALRMFLTLPVTNCEGQRSFSHMARIKNELRTKKDESTTLELSSNSGNIFGSGQRPGLY